MPFDASQSFEVVQPPETEPRPTQPPDYVDPRVKAVMSIPTDTGRLAGINAAREAQLPPEAWAPWISTIHTESNWNLNAPDGAAGEIGPGQIKPGTGRMVGYSPDELRDAQKNLVASAKYFGQKWQQGDGDPVAAFTGYNSGSVRGKAGPDYVDKGIGRLDQWGYFGAPSKNPVQQAALDPNQPFRVGTPSPKSSGSAPTSSGFDPNKPFEVQQQHSPSGERGPQYLPPNTYINMHQNPLPEAPMDEGNYVSKISAASPEDQANLRLSGELGALVATTPGVAHAPTMADQVVANGVPTPNTQTIPMQGDLTPGVAGTAHSETAVDRVAAEIARGASEGWNGTDTTILPEKVQARLDEAQQKGGLTGYLAALASTAAEDVKVPVAVWNAATSAFQKGIVQAGEEVGNYPSVPMGLGDVPAFARDVAALPEAFPAGGVETGLHVVPEAASPRAAEAPNSIYDAMQQRANETPEQTAGRQARDQTETEAAERDAAMTNQTTPAQAQSAGPAAETPPAPAQPTPAAQPSPNPAGPAHDLALTELERIAAGRPAQPTPVPPAENPAMGELERIAAGQPETSPVAPQAMPAVVPPVSAPSPVAPQPTPPPAAAAPPVTQPAPEPAPPPAPQSTTYQMFDPSQLTLAPKLFQFKAADEQGVTGALRGAAQWEPTLANPITVWQGNDGNNYVVNGHQRTDLALRAQAAGQQNVQMPALVFREADGYTPEYMRTLGAYQNIAEGSGTAIDAAKVLRGATAIPDTMRLPGLPPKSQLVQQGQALAKLSGDAFGMVVNDIVPAAYAAHVGNLISDPAEQIGAMQVLARADPANSEQARLMVEMARNSGFAKGVQTGLFGDEDFARSLIPERARVLDRSLRSLRQLGGVFKAAVEGEETLTSAGNRMDTASNTQARTENERLYDAIQRNGTVRGPVSDALNRAATDLADGKPIATVSSRFLAEARNLVRSGQSEGVQPGADVGGVEPEKGGAGGVRRFANLPIISSDAIQASREAGRRAYDNQASRHNYTPDDRNREQFARGWLNAQYPGSWLDPGNLMTAFSRDSLGGIAQLGWDSYHEKFPQSSGTTVNQTAVISSFQTSRGSTYEVHGDGTTTRNKAARSDAGHEGDFGQTARSERTIYVDPKVATNLSGAGLTEHGGKGFRLALKDGKANLLSWNKDADKWGVAPSSRSISFSTTPEVGSAPIEAWVRAGDVPDHEAYKRQHAGNEITSVGHAVTPPIGLPPIRPLSRTITPEERARINALPMPRAEDHAMPVDEPPDWMRPEDQAAEYRDELPGEGLFAGRPLPSMGEVITKGDLWKLPREELESMRDDESFSDHAKLVRVLGGEDAAKEFNRLDRKQNSSNPDRADEGAREFDAKFGNLTPEQERLIYGTGETGPSVDDIEDVLKAHQTRSGDPEDAAYEAALAMRRVTAAEMMEVPTGQASSAAQSAYVRLRNAYEDMANAGLDSRQIENNILGALVRRGWKEGDAREVIGEFINQMGKLSGVNRLEAGRRLPAPPPTAGTDLFGTTRAQPTTRAPEPTIRTDARQTTLEGMEPSARQAQAASDAQGPRSNQQAANEGLFAPAATPQPELTVAPRTSRWPQTAGDNFRDLLNEIRTAGHQTAADFVLQRGVTTGHEHIAVVDNHTGEIVHAGTNNEVNKAGFRGDNGSTEVDRYTLHHNHPNSTALSGGDLMMLANPGISHVVAHGHDGTTTTASLSPKMAENRAPATSAIARNGEALRRASDSAHILSEHILVPLAKSGVITEEEGNRLYGDIANRLLDAQGLISYQSTVELPSEVRAAFGAALEKLGHGADVVDRSSGTVSAEDRIEGLPAPTREPEGTGNSARGSESTGLSDTQRTAGNVRGRGDTLLEGDERGIQAGLSAGEDRPQEQRAAILHNLRNGPLPPRGMPNLIDQGPPRPIKQFQTAKGSVYQVHDDGTTTRNKSFHPEHGAADQGLKTRSERTIYVDPTVASELSGAGLNGLGPKGFRLALKDGKAWGLTWNNAADRWGVSPSAKEIPFETQPRVGLSPVEGWRKTNDVPGYEAYEGQHAGNAITGVSPAEPRASTAARGSESVLPLSEPPQPDNTPHGNEPPPPDSLWGGGSEPPVEPPRAPEIEAARITRPQAVKNLNVAENLTIMPQTLAALDEPSARLWNTWQNRARDETINAGQLRQVITPNFLKLSKPERLHVAGALEIARIEGEENLFANPDGTITAHNNAISFARWSKVGDALHLTPQETAAYHEAVQLGKDQWTMLMKGAARRYGWGGDIDPAVIREAANQHGDPGDYKKLNRLADLLDVMRQHEQDVYFPMQRFGSYFIAIRPKSGPDVAANLGGHPPLAWFETVEKPAFQDLFGVTNGKLSVQNVAAKRIAELQKQFPPDKFDIRQGDFVRTPGLLRQINIPAVEKLFMLMENKVRAAVQDQVMRGDNPPTTKSGVREEARNRYDELHGSTLEAFYDALFEELKSGYRHKANVVPGYSADFDRAVSSHLYQIARNSADMVHRDGIESAYQNIQDFHPHDNVKKYWKNWRAYQEDPGSALGRAAATMNQIGFTYMLGMNPSSTMIIASHMPMTAAPVLSVGVGPHVAVPAMIRGLKNAYGSLRFDSVHGAHIDLDKAMAGMPPEKQAFLRLMASEGRLAAVGTHDMAALNDKMAALFRGYADTARRGMEIATSNVHAVDQANRFAVASAAWDIANNPAHFNAAAAPLMRHNAIFRDMVQREMGLSRESYGRFMLSKAAFDWGKESHAPLMRGPLGQLMFALHGFQTRYLSTAFNLMKNGGPEGKFGFGLMMAALGLGAGALGLPFSEDAMKGADAVWHHFTGHDPDIMHKIHDAIQDTGMGQTGADMILHGPLSVLTGVNLGSRIGFGDVLSREFESSNALGTIPSIAWSAYSGASQRAESGQSPAAIAAEAAPGALRGPLRAYAETQQGVTSRRGVQQIAPEEISGTDLAKTSLGFQPLSVMRRQDEANRYYKAQGSQEGWAAMIKSGDTENAIKEMAAAGWGSGRIRGFIRQANQPPTVGKQFQRFEQNRAVAPPP